MGGRSKGIGENLFKQKKGENSTWGALRDNLIGGIKESPKTAKLNDFCRHGGTATKKEQGLKKEGRGQKLSTGGLW